MPRKKSELGKSSSNQAEVDAILKAVLDGLTHYGIYVPPSAWNMIAKKVQEAINKQ